MSLSGSSPGQIQITVQDTEQGIGSIGALVLENALLSIPSFAVGTTSPIIVTATKIDLTRSARVVLQACTPDECCLEGDPVITTLQLTTGRWVWQAFTGIPPAEHFVTIQNGNPGLDAVYVVVNGSLRKVVKVDDLGDGEETTLDISSLMHGGDNAVTLIGKGKPGASAVVVISDSVDSEITVDEGVRGLGRHTVGPRHSQQHQVWGNLVEHKELTYNQNGHLTRVE
jgi:hypothetical protein